MLLSNSYYSCLYSLARWHDELGAVVGVVHGCYGPGDSDAQEHVYGVTSRNVTHGVVRGAVLDSGHLAGKRI